MCIGLIVWVVLISAADLANNACETSSKTFPEGSSAPSDYDNCYKETSVIMYCAWAGCCVVFIPLQLLIVSIFKAYRDDIKDEGYESLSD